MGEFTEFNSPFPSVEKSPQEKASAQVSSMAELWKLILVVKG